MGNCPAKPQGVVSRSDPIWIEHVGMLGDVVHDVVGRQAQSVLAVAPHVLGAPVPTFPTVGVPHHLGEAAGQGQEVHHDAVDAVHRLGLSVSVAVSAYGKRPVLRVHPPDLVGDDRSRLVPADAHELALAPILGIAPAGTGGARSPFGIPVDSLQRILDAVGRVDPLLVGQMERGEQALEGSLIDDAVLLQRVLAEFLFGVALLVVVRPYAHDLAVFDVDAGDLTTLGKRALTERLQNRLVCYAGRGDFLAPGCHETSPSAGTPAGPAPRGTCRGAGQGGECCL